MSTINLSHAEKLRTLFISYDKNFIEQFADGTYRTYSDGSQFLGIDYINEHLKGTRTFGVLEAVSTRFMSFDIDDDNKSLVNAVLELLLKYGFPDNSIHVNESGKKGYHVHVFFSEPVSLNQCNLIQHCILYELHETFPSLNTHKVELRPLPGKGIKLPLGVHRVTERRCWFCNKETLEPIAGFDYINSIVPNSRELFNSVQEYLAHRNSVDKIVQKTLNLIGQKLACTTASPYEILSSFKIERIGTRHNLLVKLCRELLFAGVSRDDCLQHMMIWIDNQNKANYSTPKAECIEDIHKIVDSVYGKYIIPSKVIKSATVWLKRSEVRFILTLRPLDGQKPTLSFMKVLLYFIINHRESDLFTTSWLAHTNSSIAEKTGIKSPETVRRHIHSLVELGYIKMRKGTCTSDNFYYNRYGNPANEYKITQKLIDDMAAIEYACEHHERLGVLRSNPIERILRDAANEFYTRKELRDMLPRSQYENLCCIQKAS